MSNNESEKFFAFWTSDSYPYVVGSPANRIKDTETMKTDWYGQWGMSSVVALLPLQEGEKTLAELKAVKTSYELEKTALKEKYMQKAKEIFPSLQLVKVYGGSIR